jgi:hypothetical protein
MSTVQTPRRHPSRIPVVLAALLLLLLVITTTRPNDPPVVWQSPSGAGPSPHEVLAPGSPAPAFDVSTVPHEEVAWPVAPVAAAGRLDRTARLASQRAHRTAATLPADQELTWTYRSCEPSSGVPTGTGKSSWAAMRGVRDDCVFADSGRWINPVDKRLLHEDAARYSTVARSAHRITGEGPRDHRGVPCGQEHLTRLHETVFTATMAAHDLDLSRDLIDPDAKRKTPLARDLTKVRLRHPRCELPDPDRPYQWLVMLTAAALERGQPHPIVAFVGDSVHRNMMAAMMAVLRGQRDTVVDRQTHMPARYVLTTHGDYWRSDGHVSRYFGRHDVAEPAELRGDEVLLELIFGPTFGLGTYDVPTGPEIIPRAPASIDEAATVLVLGGLSHVEYRCRERKQVVTLWGSLMQTLAKYMVETRPPKQVMILRGATDSLKMPPPGITAWHDWRNGVYQELIAQAHERGHSAGAPESGDAPVGARTPLTNVFFLDSLESHDHQNDGFASEHRQLYPTDSIHYGCVARAAVPFVVERWDYQWWQCRAHHDKAHAALVVAMAFASCFS